MEAFKDYLKEIQKVYDTEKASEHSYRHTILNLIPLLDKKLSAINEPKRIECGAPDYIVLKGDAPLGYIEAKDIDKSLDDIEKDGRRKKPTGHDGEQFKRYTESLPNFILTNYLEFRWYEGGERRLTATLARIDSKGKVKVEKESIEDTTALFSEFIHAGPPVLADPKDLAARMAGIARLIRSIIEEAYKQEGEEGSLHSQMAGFKKVLLHDLKLEQFADMYAQTICYGLFAARCAEPEKRPFTRQIAAYLLPKTNPFLKDLFGHIAGPTLNDNVTWAVDNMAALLDRANIDEILTDFGKRTRQEDPVVHFYETFLAAYDRKLRETRGVYYTPEPVVSYIVRSVDHLLKTEFGLKDGLADNTMIEYEVTETDKDGKTHKKKVKSHKVLFLDPAAGTGTFLYGVIKHIHEHMLSKGQKGAWSSYVSDHLLPRLFGFELLMAPYTVAHMKLGLLLQETGYDFKAEERLRIYLTNTLEEAHEAAKLDFFGGKIAEEANKASEVKSERPVMVILGNPPYSGHSQTPNERIVKYRKGQRYYIDTAQGAKERIATKDITKKEKTFIGRLIQDYFQVDGKPLGERNPKWLNDDYVKFIRFAQWRIDKTGYGILAFITNNGYLDNPTFRGMRQSLMSTFDNIHILDLHGSSKKKEKCPDGSKDENVFDIQQGVAIGVFTNMLSDNNSVATVYHSQLWGTRGKLIKDTAQIEDTNTGKYHWLSNKSIDKAQWKKLMPNKPFYLFIPQDKNKRDEYNSMVSINDIFIKKNTGVITSRDKFVIGFTEKEVENRLTDFIKLDPEDNRTKYKLRDVRERTLQESWDIVKRLNNISSLLKTICYRPFDFRTVFYHHSLVRWPVYDIMKHMLTGDNIALISARSNKSDSADHFFLTKNIMETKCGERTTQSCLFPLYLYPADDQSDDQINLVIADTDILRLHNFSETFISEFARRVKLSFDSKHRVNSMSCFGPKDMLHYIYAVFYAPTYRIRYAEFLKIDFPRLPLTSNKDLFRELCKLGERLVGLHLMEADVDVVTQYPIDGENEVEKVRFAGGSQSDGFGKVWINKEQFFDGVPEKVWEFHIGGYQVCHKWLKDRKGRKLTFDDIQHYQYIVAALNETIDIMTKIDEVIDAHGGWPIK